MAKMVKTLGKHIDDAYRRVITTRVGIVEFCILFLAILVVRLLLVRIGHGLPSADFMFQYYNVVHITLFFALTGVAVAGVLRIFAGFSIVRSMPILAAGLPIMLIAPAVELVMSENVFRSGFYEIAGAAGLWHAFVTFFGHSTGAITIGTRIEIAMVIVGVTCVVACATRSWLRTVGASVSMYLLLFGIAAFPSIIVLAFVGPLQGISSVTGVMIASIFLSPQTLLGVTPSDIGISIHTHFIAAVTPILTIIAVLWGGMRHLWRSPIFLGGLAGSGIWLAGAIAGVAFSSATWRVLMISPFALPALATLAISAGFLGSAAVVLYRGKEYNVLGGSLAVMGIVLAGTMQPMTAMLGIFALGVWIVGIRLPMLFCERMPIGSIIGTATLSMVVFFVGGIAATTQHVTVVTTGTLLLWVGVVSALVCWRVIAPVSVRRHLRTFATGVFGVIVAMIPTFGIFDYSVYIIAAASVVYAVILWRGNVDFRITS